MVTNSFTLALERTRRERREDGQHLRHIKRRRRLRPPRPRHHGPADMRYASTAARNPRFERLRFALGLKP